MKYKTFDEKTCSFKSQIDILQQAFNQLQKDLKELKGCV